MTTDTSSAPEEENAAAPAAAGTAADDEFIHRLAGVPGLDAGKGLRHLRGRVDSYRRLLLKFAEARAADIEAMQAHVAAHRHSELFSLAHNIKGVAGFLGAADMETLASDLCAALRAGSADAEIDGIAAALVRAQSELETGLLALIAPASRAD